MNPWLSAFLNSLFFMVAGAIMVYIGMSMMFPKRRPPGVFVAYMLIKGLLWSIYDASYVLGTMGELEYMFQMVGTPLLGVASYIVLYYTWKGDFYKIGLGGFLLDALMSAAMTPVFVLADQLFASMAPLDYRGYLGLATLFRCAGMSALNLLFLYLARPIFRWFGSYEFVHKNIWQAVVIASIVMATLPRMTTTVQVARPVSIALALAAFLLIPFAGYMVSRMRIERKRKELLESEIKLAEDYGRSVREQLANLETSMTQLDDIAAKVARIQNEVEEADLKEQVNRLHAACEKIKHGSYSDSPALDVALTFNEGEFAKEGVAIEYRVSSIGDAAITAALVSQTMLSWALDSCRLAKRQNVRRRKGAQSEKDDEGNNVVVKFRIVREGDQLAFALDLPSNWRRRFPRRLLKNRVPGFDGSIFQTDDGQRKVVRALVPVEREAQSDRAS